MPRVYIYTANPRQTAHYTVDRSVGLGCVNERSDVLLVQFFLKAAAKAGGGAQAIQPPGARPIKVDGLCGPQTIAHIKHFQAAGAQMTGTACLVDGKVAPMHGGSAFGPLTIQYLNGSYIKRFGKERHMRLDLDADFPASLRASFFI